MRWEILDVVPAEQARALLAVTQRKQYIRGQSVFTEGEQGESLYFLEKGTVAARVTTPEGEIATLRILAAGDVFGELALISPGRRNATIVALEDVTVRIVHRDQFKDLRANYPAVDQVLIKVLANEVRRLSKQVQALMHVPAPQRVAACLLDLADTYAVVPGPVTIPLTQEDIGHLCGLTRPTTNQVLKHLQADDVINVARGRIIVHDQERLLEVSRSATPT